MNASGLKRLGAVTVLMTPLFTACHSAPTRLYTLYAVAPVSTATRDVYAGPPIRVDAVHFPAQLDRIEVVRNVAPGELRLSDVEHWSAPLGIEAKQTLSADLTMRLPAGKTIYPHLPKPEGALGVSVDVLDFKEDRGGVYLQASWTLAAVDETVAAGGATATLRTDLMNSEATALAQALSTLLGQLADHIVAGL